MPTLRTAPKFPPEAAPPILFGSGPPITDNIAVPENLIFRCRLLSVWRDGPFLTLVIPTTHSRANLSKDETRELLQALGANAPHKVQPPKTNVKRPRKVSR